jgi:transcriptional antiterminator RfaH
MTTALSPRQTGGYAAERCAFAPSQLALSHSERWYVAATAPRKERIALDNLVHQGFRGFLPTLIETRRHARQFRTATAPLFPRYVFVVLDRERPGWRRVNGTRGVERLIADRDGPVAVAPGVVEALAAASDARGVVRFGGAGLAIGDAVRVVAGPFAGALGVLARLDGPARAQVLLTLLGGTVKVAAAREWLAAV